MTSEISPAEDAPADLDPESIFKRIGGLREIDWQIIETLLASGEPLTMSKTAKAAGISVSAVSLRFRDTKKLGLIVHPPYEALVTMDSALAQQLARAIRPHLKTLKIRQDGQTEVDLSGVDPSALLALLPAIKETLNISKRKSHTSSTHRPITVNKDCAPDLTSYLDTAQRIAKIITGDESQALDTEDPSVLLPNQVQLLILEALTKDRDPIDIAVIRQRVQSIIEVFHRSTFSETHKALIKAGFIKSSGMTRSLTLQLAKPNLRPLLTNLVEIARRLEATMQDFSIAKD